MLNNIDFDNAKYIIEYGPGTGVFTKELIARRKSGTIIMSIEKNTRFYEHLKKKFAGVRNLILINDTAENVDKHMKDNKIPYADYIVSTLPYIMLPEDVTRVILLKSNKALKQEGKFLSVSYSHKKDEFVKKYFKDMKIDKQMKNIPPIYIFNFSKK